MGLGSVLPWATAARTRVWVFSMFGFSCHSCVLAVLTKQLVVVQAVEPLWWRCGALPQQAPQQWADAGVPVAPSAWPCAHTPLVCARRRRVGLHVAGLFFQALASVAPS